MVSLEDLTEGSDAEMVTGQSASFDLSAPGVLEPITDNEGLELVRPHERSTIHFRREAGPTSRAQIGWCGCLPSRWATPPQTK